MDGRVVMKVYLAGPSGEIDRVRAVAAHLEEAGHTIVDKWWSRIVLGVPDDKLDGTTLRASTEQCLAGIRQADALVALPGLLTLRLSTGVAVEVGYALAHKRHVVLLGAVEGLPFRTYCHIAGDLDALVQALRTLLRGPQEEQAVQVDPAPPVLPGLAPALVGGSDVAVEVPPPSQGRRPDAREKIETLAAMVRRAAREVRDRPVREALLVDLEREIAEGVS